MHSNQNIWSRFSEKEALRVNNAAQMVGDITEHSVVLRGGIARMSGKCYKDFFTYIWDIESAHFDF